MTQEVFEGDAYRLELDFRAPLLTVRVFGNADSSLPITREYWLQIAAKVRALAAGKLLVLDAKDSPVMSDADLVIFFDELAGKGLEGVQTAYVEGRVDQMSRIQQAELMALERGYQFRVFSDAADALLWLRYGGS